MPDQLRGPAYPLYERVRREAALKGWGTVELCSRAQISRNTLGKLATQPKSPQPDTVIRLADALGVDREEALELAGILPPPAGPPEDAPPLVVLRWGDRDVRKFWGLRVSAAQRLAFIERYLAEREESRPESAV